MNPTQNKLVCFPLIVVDLWVNLKTYPSPIKLACFSQIDAIVLVKYLLIKKVL